MKIGTHSGSFHCDEALACYMLKTLKDYKDAEIVRSRDKKVLDECQVVVDVGGEYDPSRMRFDHHQRGFTETFSEKHTIKLSSAGLVYKHFGKQVLKSLADLSPSNLDKLYLKIYDNFIKPLDAIDNGISQYNTTEKPLYRIDTDISSRVKNLNAQWNAKKEIPNDLLFQKAMDLVGSEFIERVNYFCNHWLPANKIVCDAINERLNVDNSGKIIVISQFCPWKSHLFDNKQSGDVLYVLYEGHDCWRVAAVPIHEESFENRKPLKKEWRGLNGEELVKTSSIEGAVFVHASGFVGGCKTYDGVLKMARMSMVAEE